MTGRLELQNLRRTLGVSARDLAAHLGTSPGAISRFENGARPLPRGLNEEDYVRAIQTMAGETGRPAPTTRPRRSAFLAIPFRTELREFSNRLTELLQKYGFQTRRADDFMNQHAVLKDIVQPLAESDLVIADLTGLNPNVMYELGLAHAFDTPVILITQNIDDLPFDLRGYRVLEYSLRIGEFEAFEGVFERRLGQIVAGSAKFGSPVSDFLGRPVKVVFGITEARALEQAGGNRDATPVQAEAEAGILNHFEDVVLGVDDISKEFDEISTATVDVGSTMVRATSVLNEASQEADQRSKILRMRLAVRMVADGLRKYRDTVSSHRHNAAAKWSAVDGALQPLLAAGVANTVADTDELSSAIETYEQLERSILEALDSIHGMNSAMSGVVGFERTINQEAAATRGELDQLEALMSAMAATARRAHEFLKQKVTE